MTKAAKIAIEKLTEEASNLLCFITTMLSHLKDLM